MKSADERIAEALKQPIETPDMTDFVMARLPIEKRWRLKWAYAAAIPVLIVAVVLFLSRGQKPEYQAIKQPAPVSQAPTVRSVPTPPVTLPKTITAQKPQPRRPSVRRHRYASKPVVKPPEPKREDSPPLNDVPSDELLAIKQAIVQTALEQIRPVTHTLPPNEDAETIERPALEVIANCGPIQVPVEELGG